MKNYHITSSNSAHQQLSSVHWHSRWLKMFRRGGGNVTTRTHLGRSWVWGGGMSDVALQISMKNYHITIGISMVRSTSTAKFVEVRYRAIGIVQEGHGDVTTRIYLGLIWVWNAHPFHVCTRPRVSSFFPRSWPQDTNQGCQWWCGWAMIGAPSCPLMPHLRVPWAGNRPRPLHLRDDRRHPHETWPLKPGKMAQRQVHGSCLVINLSHNSVQIWQILRNTTQPCTPPRTFLGICTGPS